MIGEKELLRLLQLHRQTAIGFENDAELRDKRAQALNYYKGEMPDVKALANRSKAVSNDLCAAVDTLMPDLMEIFTGGADVAVFTPHGEEDEEAAQQETDYVNHVVFHENPGFLILHTMIKDALLENLGIATYYWAECFEEESFEGKTQDELALVVQDGAEIKDVTRSSDGASIEDGAPIEEGDTFNFTAVYDKGRLKIDAFAPEDFAVAPDTITLRDGTYCAFRSRPRVQDLIADGVDPVIARKLDSYYAPQETENEMARDNNGETQNTVSEDGGLGDLRQVELFTHFLRCDYEGDGKLRIIRVVTDKEETLIVEKPVVVSTIQFAAITPFIVGHRFYGQSVHDKLGELMRIRTAITRMVMDSGYFALNGRVEVAMDRANVYTISDLLRNEPGVPVRVKNGECVRPISSGNLNFDAMGALEYFATAAEQAHGIVRNAQGLNPDTLHDTAKGAMALMTMAQKRTRMIARVFAETGFKDLFLGVHALLKEHASKPAVVRLRGKWSQVTPTSWGERKDMTIEIGLGAGGREHDQQMMGQIMAATKEIIGLQGGTSGPFVTADNTYNVIKNTYEKFGVKAPELYVTDPKTVAPQPEKPDPEMVKIQLEHDRKMEEMKLDHELKQQQQVAEVELQREKIQLEARAKMATAMMGGPSPSLPNVRPGGQVG